MNVRQVAHIDTSRQRDQAGKLYYPSLRFGVKKYGNFGKPAPILMNEHSKEKKVEVLEEACLWAWKKHGSMSLAYSRTTGRVCGQFYQDKDGTFGCLLYTPGGKLTYAQNSHLFILQAQDEGRKPERRSSIPLSEMEEAFLSDLLRTFRPLEQENWLAVLMHEPILRRIIAYCAQTDGAPPLDALERWVRGTADLLISATSLRIGQGLAIDPIKSFLEVFEALAVRSFGFDGVDVFRTHYQASELCAGLTTWLTEDRRETVSLSPVGGIHPTQGHRP